MNPFSFQENGLLQGTSELAQRWGPLILYLHEYAHYSRKLPGGATLPSMKASMFDVQFDEETAVVSALDKALWKLPGLVSRARYAMPWGEKYESGKQWIRLPTLDQARGR